MIERLAVDFDDAGCGIVKPLEQGGDGGFARARGADEGHALARFNAQIHPGQHIHIGAVGIVKVHIFKADVAAQLKRGVGLVVPCDDFLAGFFHQFHQAFDGAQSPLQCRKLCRNAANGSGDQTGHEEEGEEVFAGQAAFHHQFGPFENYQGDGTENEQDDERSERTAPDGPSHGKGTDVLDAVEVAHHFPRFIGKTLDADDARQRFLNDGVGFGDLVLRAFRKLADEAPKQDGRDDHDREGRQHQQREGHREVKQGQDAPDDDDDLPQQFSQGGGEHVLNGGDVRGHPAVQVAHAPRIEEFHRHAHNRFEGVVPHGQHHVFGHFGKKQHSAKTQRRLNR